MAVSVRLIIGGLWMLPVLAGCEDSRRGPRLPSLPPPQVEPGHIAVVGAAAGDPLWPLIRASIERSGFSDRDLGLRLAVPPGPSGREHAALLRTFDGKLRGLCIHAPAMREMGPELNQELASLQQRGVRIVTLMFPAGSATRGSAGFDSARKTAEPATQPAPPLSRDHVGVDDAEVGRLLALATKQEAAGGTYMLLHAGYSYAPYALRLIGFDDEMKLGGNVEGFARLDCGADPGRAREIMAERSARYPRLSAWVSLDDWPLRGLPAASTLPASGPATGRPASRAPLIVFGGTPDQWPLLRAGAIRAMVAPDYSDMGARAVEFCRAGLRDSIDSPRRYNAPLEIVTRDTLEGYVERWKKWEGDGRSER